MASTAIYLPATDPRVAEKKKEAEGIYYCLVLTRLWVNSTALPKFKRDSMANDERVVAEVYADTIRELARIVGFAQAEKMRAQIEAACVIPEEERPPAQQTSLF